MGKINTVIQRDRTTHQILFINGLSHCHFMSTNRTLRYGQYNRNSKSICKAISVSGLSSLIKSQKCLI